MTTIEYKKSLSEKKNRPNFEKAKVGDYIQNWMGVYFKITFADGQIVKALYPDFTWEIPESAIVFDYADFW
jgi:hypothetical protein